MRNNLSSMALKSAFIIVLSGLNIMPAYSQASADYAKLKQDYDAVVADRNNILAQTKLLQDYKNKYLEMDLQTKKLINEKEQLQREIQARSEQDSAVKLKMEELQNSQTQALQEKETLKNSLEKMQIEYKIVPETRKESNRLQKDLNDAIRRYKIAEQKIKRLEEEKLDISAQNELYRRYLGDSKEQYNKALAKNKVLEKKVEQMPKRFTELARENKVLIKETALMHYNLGVFYTQNKEYSRAIAEYEKTLELNPDDAYAHYNLGYVYAEYMVNRPKAIEHFRQFLRLSKSEDKDVDWVRKYILTWQTWEGKKPVE